MPEYNVSVLSPGDDLESFAELIHEAVRDVQYLGVTKLDHDKLLDSLTEMVFSPIDQTVILVLYYGEVPVGLLAGTVNNNHPVFQETKIATEIFWYVDPEHRNKNKSLDLIDAYETWARKVGAGFVAMGHFHDDTGVRLEKVYKKMGYAPLEHTYIKQIEVV